MKKIFFIITLLFFPTSNHGAITSYITNPLKSIICSRKIQGTVGGAGIAIIIDAIVREIIEKINEDEACICNGKKQKSLPPTSLLSIILCSIYGSCNLNRNLPPGEKVLDAAKVSLIYTILYTLWRLGIEVSTTNQNEQFGLSKNFLNGLKQFLLNFTAVLSSHGIATRRPILLYS